jgi:ribonuclease T2
MRRIRRALPVLAALAHAFAGDAAGAAERGTAGVFDYYVLVLSWTPSYCRAAGRVRQDGQCEGSQRPAFRLHGLWPQYEEGWPQDCSIGKRPWVPDRIIREMRDIMPSKNLLIHEYRAHGTCSGLDPSQYFAVARQLYQRVGVPEQFRAPDADRVLSPGAIESEFLGANPWLKPEMISVSCRQQNLIDIRVCFGRDLFPRACGANEDQKRLCPATAIDVPPVKP